jgi:uncharacterized membrane protein
VTDRTRSSRRARRVTLGGFYAGVVVELLLIGVGVAYLLVPQREPSAWLLATWCALGAAYVVGVAVTLYLASRFAESDEPPRLLEISVVPRVIAVIATAFASVIGVAVTIQHIFLVPTDDFDALVRIIGIVAMILAWALFHWGFAQLYLQLYYRENQPPLRFPSTRTPGILEFAYFAFTIAVSLAASDVDVLDRRMRFRVMVHAVIGFFFNGLIIVTALGAIGEAGRV